MSQFLKGYNSIGKAYEVKDYPYGFRLRTSIFYWIESKPGNGDRFCSYTINPKKGKPNKPKCGTYATFMYLYLDEQGHVEHGKIDSYDCEQFKARFQFILEKIGVEYINEIQQQNLRVNHYQHVKLNAPYEIVKYSDAKKDEYKQWLAATLSHIKNCDFKELVNYPEKPEYDNPGGEVKTTIKQY